MKYDAWFAAQDDPNERYPLTEVVYYSKSGGLLEVVHDMDALRQRSGEDLTGFFSSWLDTTRKPGRTADNGLVGCD